MDITLLAAGAVPLVLAPPGAKQPPLISLRGGSKISAPAGSKPRLSSKLGGAAAPSGRLWPRLIISGKGLEGFTFNSIIGEKAAPPKTPTGSFSFAGCQRGFSPAGFTHRNPAVRGGFRALAGFRASRVSEPAGAVAPPTGGVPGPS